MAISDQALIDAAIDVRERAYAAYSGYRVGAALVDDGGHLHVGCNVENETYPLGFCAEAGAIASMVANGGRRVVRIAVAGGNKDIDVCMPCGACRQRLLEFADEDTRVLLLQADASWRTWTLAELLPAPFRLERQ